MSLQDVVAQVKTRTEDYAAGAYQGFLAIQVTLTDLDDAKFYIELKDGVLAVEPHEYNDYQANLRMSSENFIKMINKELNSVTAFLTGKLKIDGDKEKAKELSSLFKSSAE